MANEYYITAGLTAIDFADKGSIASNAYYITAGLTANDRPSTTPTVNGVADPTSIDGVSGVVTIDGVTGT
jgi:hypothetical protein